MRRNAGRQTQGRRSVQEHGRIDGNGEKRHYCANQIGYHATNYAYGAPFDYILHPSATSGDDGLTAMLGLLRTFMARGGYGMQGNILDSKKLRDAQRHPENYENLQIRICGWNWYFNKMEKMYQDEFIKRAESIE